MASMSPVRGTVDAGWSATRLTRLSLVMLVVFIIWGTVLGFFGSMVLMPWLGLSEGDLLLMAGGVAGWVAQVVMSLLLVVPAVVGIALAVKALRRGGKALAWLALGLNVLPVVQVVFSFIDAVHMTYYPQGGWLIW